MKRPNNLLNFGQSGEDLTIENISDGDRDSPNQCRPYQCQYGHHSTIVLWADWRLRWLRPTEGLGEIKGAAVPILGRVLINPVL
jgi:hypothetical protein